MMTILSNFTRIRACIIAVPFVLSAWFLAAPAAQAQELWQGAKKGDSLADLRAKFPEAQFFAEPVEYADGRLASIFIDNRSVGGEVFDVIFVMNGDALETVALRMNLEDTGQIPNRVHFHALEALLSRKYGAALYEMPTPIKDPGFLRLYKNEFREGDLTIGIVCMFCGNDDGFLGINYELTTSEKADEF